MNYYSLTYSDETKQFLVIIFSCTSVRTLKQLTTAVLMPCHQRTLLIQKHVTIRIRKFVMNAMASPVYWMSYREQLVAMRLTSLIMTRKMTFNIQLQRYLNQNIKSIFDLYRYYSVPSCRVTKYGMISGQQVSSCSWSLCDQVTILPHR